jgi:tryptophan synthase alpha chain
VKTSAPLALLENAFASGQAESRALVMPYLVVGYPSASSFVSLARAAAESGADVLELGIPFSDPIMDGPVIQRASSSVLQRGLHTSEALELIGEAALAAGIPVVVMTYYNVVFRYGPAEFAHAVARYGGSGVIVPDLPVEEAGPWRDACAAAGIGPVMIAAPTSGPKRLRALAECSGGFVYAASTLGVTGLRSALSSRARALVAELRKVTKKPVAVGIGVSNAEQAREVASYADGVIVGTAVVKAIEENADPVPAVSRLIRDLSSATRP